MRQSNSWGHVVFKATPTCSWQRQCSTCKAETGYVTRYLYITGRAGRTSSSDRWVCLDHATKFAAKHGLSILDKEPGPRFTDEARISA